METTALFIDGDNIHVNDIKFAALLNKIKCENNLILKRVYGDWKLESMNVFWDKQILDNGLEEIQISRLAGKNSTDSKIIVDMMHCLFYHNHITKYILIGCDKDYIPLIRYVMQCNKKFEVFGLKKQTSLSIINSCSVYYDIDEYVEPNLSNEINKYQSNNKQKEQKQQNQSNELNQLNNSIDINNDERLILLNELVKDKDGICISELKKKIRERKKKELYGKEYRTLNVFIKNNYKNYFDVKMRKGRLMIYKLN